jgi:hypothetical protein
VLYDRCGRALALGGFLFVVAVGVMVLLDKNGFEIWIFVGISGDVSTRIWKKLRLVAMEFLEVIL